NSLRRTKLLQATDDERAIAGIENIYTQRVQVDEQAHGGDCVGQEGDEEVEDTITHQQLPQLRASRGHEQTNQGQDQDDEIQIHEVEEETLNGLDIAGLGGGVVLGLDGGDTMEEDTPLACADQSQGNDDVELLVPDGNGPIFHQTRQDQNKARIGKEREEGGRGKTELAVLTDWRRHR
ncbi:5943_t:CDS:2, partial [Acaulospora colombiana]